MTNIVTEESYPVKQDWPVMVRGADWHVAFQYMQDDRVTPMDTTGYTCQMIIKESDNGETYATLTTSDAITMTAASGLFNIDLTAAEIDAYTWRSAIYKIIVTDSSSGKTPLFMGDLRIVG